VPSLIQRLDPEGAAHGIFDLVQPAPDTDETMIRQLEEDVSFPSLKSRTSVATADDVIAARKAAHARGAASRALCYAIQFETVLRQWDVRGQWVPLDYRVPSTVIDGGRKWIGSQWHHIGPDLVLRYKPTKTDGTTDAEVVVDLKLCPMVLEEMRHIPSEQRSGPVIVNEQTGQPYQHRTWEKAWQKDKKDASLPTTLWNRDLRASGISEARAGGATNDDGAKVAGHSSKRTTAKVYDREHLEAQRRFQQARIKARGGEG
jgi:hypothetical protein